MIGTVLGGCNDSDSSGGATAANAAVLPDRGNGVPEVPVGATSGTEIASALGLPPWGSERGASSPGPGPLAGPARPGSGSQSQRATPATGSVASTVTISWNPPTEDTNGSPLTNLAGFTIHYGTQSQTYTGSIEIANPGITSYVVESLPAGTYYFAVTAYTTSGTSSAYSPQVSATVQ